MARRSAARGLDPQRATAVFRDQIEANKLVQRGLYARWGTHPEERPAERPDLAREVRPKLDRITGGLLDALARTQDTRTGPICAPRLAEASTHAAQTHHLDALHLTGMVRALPRVCPR